ncbi:MAG: hemolysin family protein [Pseudomonadota bacterium]
MSASTQTETTQPSTPPAEPDAEKPLEANRSLVPLDAPLDSHETASVFSWLLGLFGKRKNGSTIREDLADALLDDKGLAQGFSPEERAMLSSILHLQDKRVEDLMVPRADIIAVSQEISFAELLRVFEDSGLSRMPVFQDTLDDPRGMIHIRDVVSFILKTSKLNRAEIAKRKRQLPGNLDLKKVDLSKPIGAMKIVREVMFVPPSMGARELMARMQADRMQIALVIDEYGGTDGLVTLEDIVEEIVGDIEDEHDDEDELIKDRGDGIFVCDAKAELEDIRELVGVDFVFGEHEEDVDTIGGLIFDILGRVPVRGEVITNNGFEFRVIEADPRRIRRVELLRSQRRKGKRPQGEAVS